MAGRVLAAGAATASPTIDWPAALKEAGLGSEWDEWGTGFIKPNRWIDTVYASLTRD